MSTATPTKVLYPKNELGMRTVLALIDQHNLGVIDDHVLAAKMVADLSTATYESGLTAKEIEYTGYTATESAVAGSFPTDLCSELLLKTLIEQINARVVDLRAVVVKLNADAGVTDTDYTSTALKVFGLGVTPASAEEAELYGGAGDGPSAKLLQQLIETHNLIQENWADLCEKLDDDGGVTDTNYEAQLVAKTLTQIA